MAKDISSLNVKVGANVTPLTTSLQTGEHAIQSFQSHVEAGHSSLLSFGAMAGIAGAAVEAAAAIFEKAGEAMADAFKGAADIETAQVQLTALSGSAGQASESLEVLRKLSVNTPFALPDLVTAEKRLLAVGVSAGAIPTILNQAGNVAAGVGTDIGSIADIFARVATEGSLGSRELREFGKEGIPVVQTLAKQFNTTAEGVKELANNGQIGFAQLETAFDTMTSKGGRFSGILHAQSQTIGGVWHQVTSTIEDGSVNIAESILKAFRIAPLIEKAVPLIEGFTTKIVAGIDIIGDVVGKIFSDSDPFVPFVEGLANIDLKIVKIGVTFEEILGSKVITIIETLGQKLYTAFGPTIEIAINKIESAIAKVGKGINYVLDTILKLEGVSGDIAPPKIPEPEPVKVTTFLDPSSQTLVVQPELRKAAALRAGSAEAQAARYGHGQIVPHGAAFSTNITPASTTIPPIAIPSVMRHADPTKLNSAGQRTELGDATLGPDGLYHVKTAHGGFGGALDPEQYANLRAAEKNKPESVATALGPNMIGHGFGALGGVSSIDNWHHNKDAMARFNAPTSVDLRNQSAQWRSPGDRPDIVAWNKAHPSQAEAGAYPPGSLGPLAAPSIVQPLNPTIAAHSGGAGDKQSTEQLQSANQWLYRIENNTRQLGTSATVVSLH